MGLRAGIGIAAVVVAVVVWACLVDERDGGSRSVSISPPVAQPVDEHASGLEAATAPAAALRGPAAPELAPAARARRGPLPGCLTGRVVDRGGIPLSHASVRLLLQVPESEPNYATVAAFDRTERVDSDGRFCVEVPAGGRYLVRADAKGFALSFAAGVKPGDDLELVGDVAGRIVGRTVNKTSGKAVARVKVRAELVDPHHLRLSRDCESDPDGAYSLDDLPGGRYSITAEHDDFSYFLDGAKLEPGGQIDRTLELTPGPRISGRVVAKDTGAPIAGVRVREWSRSAVTGADGAFVLVATFPGQQNLSATGRGWRPASLQVTIDAGRDPGELVMALEPTPVIRGTVVDVQGRPLEGAFVGTTEDRCTTGPDGAFSVTASFDHFGRLDHVWASRRGCTGIEAMPSDVAEPLTITLEPADVRIAGRVVDAAGAPIAGARVCNCGVTGTDAQGRFSFEGCSRESRYEVSAYAAGYAGGTAWAYREEGTSDLEIVLQARPSWRARLEGRVVDENGSGVAGASVAWRSQEKDEATVQSASDGRFVVDATRWCEPSAVWVRAEAEGWIAQTGVPVKWEESPIPPVELVLARPRRIRGRLVDAVTREPITSGGVTVVPIPDPSRPSWPGRSERTEPDGTFEIVANAGTWRLLPWGTDYLQPPESIVKVPASVDVSLGDLPLSPWGTIEGIIKAGPDGAGARVALALGRPGERPAYRRTGTDQLGWFRLAAVAQGTWDVFGVETTWLDNGSGCSLVRVERLGTVEVTARATTRFDARMPEAAALTVVATVPAAPETAAEKRKPRESRDDDDDGDEPEYDPPIAGPEPVLTIEALDGFGIAHDGHSEQIGSTLTQPWFVRGREWQMALSKLSAGRYRVSLKPPEGEPVERVVDLMAGEKQRLVLDFAR